MTVKVLLDTDIGNDIDDAICLSHLLANPECELMGITTVSGQSDVRARLVSMICQHMGKDVPIYPGAELPLLIPPQQKSVPHAACLDDWEHQRTFPMGQSISFMRDIIRTNPGEITLITIGPLTNIAILFSLDPEIPSLLNGVYCMGGVFTNKIAGVGPLEWNIMADPHASAIVYKRAAQLHRTISLDITCQICMSKDDFLTSFKSEQHRPLIAFSDFHFQHSDMVVFHDPLAGIVALQNDICTFERGHVEIELGSHRTAGMTHWTPDSDTGIHEIASNVNAEKFMDYYFSVFN